MSQTAQSFEGQIPVAFNYLLSLPASYGQDPNEQWPLLLFLHGSGERGTDIEKVKVHGPPMMAAQGQDFPMVVCSPQLPEGQWWHETELLGLVDHIAAKYRIDPSRIYVTGLSIGAFGAFDLVAYAPERFAAAVMICGGSEPSRGWRLAKVPIRIYHGKNDDVVPVQRSEEMAAAIKKAGGDVTLTVYPDAGHVEGWQKTYANMETYEWMLTQSK